ncbi:MAG TPA: MFS transporter [Propioniciclava sp.]|uniref:MFS transporter n=1 Tax=Propioniciclava sp. TaxID=2038686 RepID=UPI002CB833BB|nr:MFS transporter [Propioniciclava sp.]HRL49518.1 MFS transporter [Propioniciclava sp.]HRL80767.1 MFS transporter [Propioniciclava sp.]
MSSDTTASATQSSRDDHDVELIDKGTRMRALMGSAVGSAVEWYGYFLYGTMASAIFGHLFFPSDDKFMETVLALASFSLAFLVRPIGGIFFSHIGDRIGRKKTLVMTLSLMGVSTAAMGLLPTHAQIGVWAGVLLTLLRLIQGLALGGEWGGGVLLAVEYSPRSKRGFYGAVPQTGALFGLALGNLTVTGLDALLSEEQFLSWGWRIPFLLSALLVLLGLWIRNKVDETPAFRKIKAERKEVKVPIVEIFKTQWPSVLKAIGAKFIETSTFFIFATFVVSYAIKLGYTRSEALTAVLVAAVIAIPCMLAIGALSDRVGRKTLYLIGTVLAVIYIVPYFWLVNLMNVPILVLSTVVGFGAIWSVYGALMGTFLAESFTADVRYTGISLGYQVGAALVGGTAPLIATALVGTTNNYPLIGIFIGFCAVVSFISVWFTRDRSGQVLD